MSEKDEQLTYESALKELQEIQNKLDEEEVAIDELAKLAKRAKFLIQWCKDKLKGIDQELSDIFSDNN
ncbi:exodeoxyribonuclease VII small subunit [Flammeovirga yaeyamensis]|uniref:Exodeoxyribonuclease VII small subunit n=1 Tax=Flammeovirga yaeyamensis TaxID=367791 RepID=A0AAX1N1H2_9BACT|nr:MULTISPECIES: exodeoxyribonuclease VII small subunit [Flammeovirga]ANQ48371.1 exodeoxyribonuclease VII small subunit [Flammeovirga sp. MY04]MBB3696273.1 exodeoxyribonuclease VII small subunit [Flammeovirga yaeyamensis]NMF34954.1 exodeoxyribonuclease VII small subunit [Flammeovirga yaeyamensis]QWG00221.1 exodeoxyribonuclease VII small subunit [Flammeovirga yaeyamensis]